MADLGNLYFNVLFRDKTQAEVDKIKKKLANSIRAKLDVDVDTSKIAAKIQSAMNNANIKVKVTPEVGSLSSSATSAAVVAASAYNGATRAITDSERATRQLNVAMERNLSLGLQLRNMFANLVSLSGLSTFARNIVEIGGELENQRIALGSILQDKGKATELFSQIKTLAIQSPFGIMDLNQYAKQLSAYSVPYNELYDTMKRLADISAGVGVDMGRIILAYGQIKAAKFLKGTELRQLTEANIPMVDKLAERFTKLKGEIVSAGDVMDMISKKQVKFEDVQAVLWQLTDDGGMFNNMQEVLSESVKSKFKNLSDAVDVMMGDIANSTNGILKFVAETLTSLAQSYNEITPLIAGAGAAFASSRIAMMYNNITLGKNGVALRKLGAETLQQERRNLRLAISSDAATIAEKRRLIEIRRLGGGLKALTSEQVSQLATTQNLTKAEILSLVARKKLTAAQVEGVRITHNITKKKIDAAVATNMWGRAWKSAGVAIRSFGTALKGLLLNPIFIIGAAFSAVFEIFQRISDKNDEIKQSIADVSQKANEGYKNLSESVKKYDFSIEGMNTGAISEALKEMTTTIKDYAPNWQDILNEAFSGTKTSAEQVEFLRGKVVELSEAYKLLEKYKDVFEEANKETDGWKDDSYSENLTDVAESYRNVTRELRKFTAQAIQHKQAITAVSEKYPEFYEQIKNLPFEEQARRMEEHTFAWSTYLSTFSKAGGVVSGDYGKAFLKLRNDMRTAYNDMVQFVAYAKQQLSDFDFNNLTEPQKQYLYMQIDTQLNKAELQGEIRQIQQRLLEESFNLPIRATIATELEDVIIPWKEKFVKAFGDGLEAKIYASADIPSLTKSLREMYKQTQDEVKELKPILFKAGITFTGQPIAETSPAFMAADEATKDIIRMINQNAEMQKTLEKGAKEVGITLGDTKKDSGSKKDTVLDNLKERLSKVKEAYSEFQKWAKEFGEDAALQKMRESDLFKDLFADPNFKVTDLKGNIKTIEEELRKALAKSDTKERRSLLQEIIKNYFTIDYDDLKKQMDDELNKVKKMMSESKAEWDVFKQIYDLTGNKELATNLAFVNKPRYFDETANAWLEQMQKLMSEKNIIGDIDWNMDEVAAKAFFNDDKSLLEMYNKLKERIEKNGIEIHVNAEKAVADTMSIEDKVRRKELQKADAIAKLEATGGTPEQIAAVTQKYDDEIAKLRSELLKLLPIWDKIFGDTTYKSYGTIMKYRDVAKELVANAKVQKDANGKPTTFTSSYTDENGKLIDVTGTYGELDRLKRAIDTLFNAGQKKNPFKALADSLKELFNPDNEATAEENGMRVGDAIAKVANVAKNAADAIAEVFDAMGNESAARALSTVSNLIGDISNIGSAFATGGIVGGAVTAATTAVSWIGKIFAAHDNALQRQIEASKRSAKVLANIYNQIEAKLQYALGEQSQSRMQQLDALKGQLVEVEKQRQAELDKKKTSKDAIIDYNNEIATLKQSIADFAEKSANDMYGLDLKSWASQIGDALFEAWEKGEDRAVAYKKTVSSLLGQLSNEILKKQIMEPAMERLRKMLFDDGGMFADDFSLDAMDVATIGAELGNAMKQTERYYQKLDEIDAWLKANGYENGLKGKNESEGLSKGIQGVTEDTANLLASYLNAIRADVSMKREYIRTIAEDYMPSFSVLAQAQLTQLQMIQQNTANNVAFVEEIRDMLHQNITPGVGFRIG